MATRTYRTKWGSSVVEISADFAQASCSIEGTSGLQVADVRHSPAEAMRRALRDAARDDGEDPDDEGIAEQIEDAIDSLLCDACGLPVDVTNWADSREHNTGGEHQCLDCHRKLIESDSDLECSGCHH